MKKEFVLAFNEVLEDRQLPKDVVMEALEAAMVSAYRKAVNASTAQQIEARIDDDTGEVTIAAEKEVVDVVQDDRTEVTLEVAREVDPETEIGNLVLVDSTPENFGRVAAQTARQVSASASSTILISSIDPASLDDSAATRCWVRNT